jgi:GNAT superfamily N-acetyltransferase
MSLLCQHGCSRDKSEDPIVRTVRIERVGYDHPDAVRLVAEVQAEYVVRYGGQDESPVDPLEFEPPHGSFFLGYVDDLPVATGAWRRSQVEAFGTTETCEIKRMYVVPAARGLGHSRRMLARLEESARLAGARALVLETGLKQPEAIALYESSGYVAVPAFGHYRDSPLSRALGKRLG